LNICDRQAVSCWFDTEPCDAYVNCAAYTAVDAAEDDRTTALAVNETGAGHIATAVARLGARLIYLSTDYVFAGTGSTAFTETDPTVPINVYGASKLAGERASLACCTAQVLRVGWVFGTHGHNFVKTILRVAAQGGPLRVVDDQQGTPCSAPSIAEVALTMLESTSLESGVYHYGAQPLTNWHTFAEEIVAQGYAAGMLDSLVEVNRQSTEDLKQKATRPRFSQLDTQRLQTALGIEIPDWRQELLGVIAEMAKLRGR
jgi:dTDP-4-dehydrorhamnose reductase